MNFTQICVICTIFVSVNHIVITNACGKCVQPWRDYGRHCYLFIESALSFQDADDYCLGMSRGVRESHLASITTEEEHDYLRNVAVLVGLSRTHLWIGYSAENTTTYSWLDGSESSNYTSWENNTQPAYSENTTCVITQGDTWLPSDCHARRPFICKMLQRDAALGRRLAPTTGREGVVLKSVISIGDIR